MEDPVEYLRSGDNDEVTLDKIVSFLNLHWNIPTSNVPTESLNVNGKAIQEAMSKYLENGETYYSSSDFKEVIKTPFHLFYHRESGWKETLNKHLEAKKHYELGTLLHECILEPAKFDRIISMPKFSFASNDGVLKATDWIKKTILEKQGEEYFANVCLRVSAAINNGNISEDKLDGKKAIYNLFELNSGFNIVDEDLATIASIVKKNAQGYCGGIINRLLRNSKREISMYSDDHFGLPVKIRPDALQFEENIGVNAIISVKTTRSPYPRKFFMDYANFDYPLSDGMYEEVASHITGRKIDTTIVIMLQTVAPFGVAVFLVKSKDRATGRLKFRHALQTAIDCKETGLYPSYESLAENGNMGISFIDLPGWYENLLPNIDVHD